MSGYSSHLGQFGRKNVVMRYEWASRVRLIFSLVSSISCCRADLFDDGQGVDMGLIRTILLSSFFWFCPVTVPVSDGMMLDVIGEVSRNDRKVFFYAEQESGFVNGFICTVVSVYTNVAWYRYTSYLYVGVCWIRNGI